MTSHGNGVSNPFRRMAQDYKEEEVIDLDDNNDDQADYGGGNYDYNDQSQNDYEPTQKSAGGGGFTMSDNKPPIKPKSQTNNLVINKPNLQAEDNSPTIKKQHTGNQLGAYAANPSRPPLAAKGQFNKPPPVSRNPFAGNQKPQLPVHNNPFANKSPGSGQQHEDSPYPVKAPKRESYVSNDDGQYDNDESRFEEVSPSQSQFNSKPGGEQGAKKLNFNNPFQEVNNQESASAPSSGYASQNQMRANNNKQADRGGDEGIYDNKSNNNNENINDPFADEPSILEELEIDPVKIRQKFLAILTYRGLSNMEIALYHDMAGPLLVIFLFGMSFIFKGRMEFGNIYGFSLTGCIGLYCIINLLSKPGQYAELYSCISILGYSLLPFCFLAMISIFVQMNNAVGYAVCAFFVFWSTATATRIFEYTLDMEDKKFLIGYPIILFYGIFVQLTVL